MAYGDHYLIAVAGLRARNGKRSPCQNLSASQKNQNTSPVGPSVAGSSVGVSCLVGGMARYTLELLFFPPRMSASHAQSSSFIVDSKCFAIMGPP